MKKVIIIALAFAASATFNMAGAAKKDKKKNKAQTEEVAAPVVLATHADTVSYAAGVAMSNGLAQYLKLDSAVCGDFVRGFNEFIANKDDKAFAARAMGYQIGKQLTSQMLPQMEGQIEGSSLKLNDAILYRAFIDGFRGDTAVFTMKDASDKFKTEFDKATAEKEAALEKPGKDFLAENAKKEGVVTLPSGLQYKIIKEGTGDKPTANDRVKVNYEGRFIDGTVFDASAKHGDKPATFGVTRVIKGWTEALELMPVGSKWQIYVPYNLAYGKQERGDIKPYSTLIFDIELVEIEQTPKLDTKKDDKAETAKKAEPAKKPTKKTAKKK